MSFLQSVLAKVSQKDIRYAKFVDKEYRAVPCVNLGMRVLKADCLCWAQDTHVCLEGEGDVQHAGKCQTCTKYEADQ